MKIWVFVLLLILQSFAYGDVSTSEQRFRDLYKELVETNTTLSQGDCTLAASRIAARLKAAGFTDDLIYLFSVPEHPKEGGIVVTYPGQDPKAKAVLLLAHLDVVEAKREDWTRDPFKLIEENGNFYGRGASDDKAQAAIWADALIRYKEEGFKPKRAIKMALTCGEEGAPFNGAAWLAKNKRDLIDAEFALNEGAGGNLDDAGSKVDLNIEVGEKIYQNFTIEITNPGGHSSRPRKDNAIYQLAHALEKIEAYTFPVELTDVTRAYLTKMATIQEAKGNVEAAHAMRAILKSPQDRRALDTLQKQNPTWAAMLHTTCVATMLEAGHAKNALPQRASANINCRIFPGTSLAKILEKLKHLIDDPKAKVEMLELHGESVAPPALKKEIVEPIERLAKECWPGVPLIPILQSGATDGIFLIEKGIPTYGFNPIFVSKDIGNIHGLNEYVRVKSLLEAREFLYRLVKIYTME